MRLIAVDPGNELSGYVVYDGEKPVEFGKVTNGELLGQMGNYSASCDICVIEMIGHYGTGMPAGKSVFDTCVWIGRFMQAFGPDRVQTILRATIKAHLCRSAKAKDGNVRQAIIDRFGGQEKAVGRKASQGPLYGISGDVWQALAVALTWADTHNPYAPAPGTLAAIFAEEQASSRGAPSASSALASAAAAWTDPSSELPPTASA